MRKQIVEQLKRFKEISGKTYRLAIVNWGGTLTCVENEKKLLAPVQDKKDLEAILFHTLGFEDLVKSNLLDMQIIYHHPMDSSQMTDADREPVLRTLEQEYLRFDGFIGIHGTDSVARTARYLHLTLPYLDPRELWLNGSSIHNWTKPFPLVSSQEPAALHDEGNFRVNVGSDAGMSIVTAMLLITNHRFGEVGVLVAREHAYRGTVYDKGSESHFNLFDGDEGVPALAKRSAFGLMFPGPAFNERPIHQDRAPFVVYGSDAYERRVLTVSEPSHLSSALAYLRAIDAGDTNTAGNIKETLPRVVLYVSKGAGNVQREEYEALQALTKLHEGQGIYVARVPLRGGRVPSEMHYDVPGGDLPGLNIEQGTARYKAQVVLALMDQLRVAEEKQRDFFERMMSTPWGREFLPTI